MRFRPEIDLEFAVDNTHSFIHNIAYHLNRRNGFFDRVDLAIKADCSLPVDSRSERQLRLDAEALRHMADKLDHARQQLVTEPMDIDPTMPF